MNTLYKKRAGTSGISGQLYETKLISLILFRLQHDDDIEEFYLASNMDDIGAFDDICLKVHIAGRERPIFVLIQARHKEKEGNILRYELIQELSASFVKIRQKFLGNDTFFNGKFEDADCVLILYTNGKYCDEVKNVWKPYRSSFSNKLNRVIATGDADTEGRQADWSDKDVEVVNETILDEEITVLAEHFAKFFSDKSNQSMNIMLDYFILRYHVILAKSVVDISEVQCEKNKTEQWRYLTFRESFFSSDDKILTKFRKKIYDETIKTQLKMKKDNFKKEVIGQSETSTVDTLILQFLSNPSALTLSPLIGTYIINKNGNMEFNIERPNGDLQKLEEINITSEIADEAETIVARNILSSLKLKVPAAFGNVDLKIPGNQKKIEKRLNTLSEVIADLCKQSEFVDPHEIITIDESVGDGFLNLNGGIGSAIGNLLVYDNNTKLLKFTENTASLQNNARSLLDRLVDMNSKGIIKNLLLYRFNVRAIVTFPKLVFDYTDEAEDIFKRAIIYDKQSNHSGVESILQTEIENNQTKNKPNNLSITSNSIFIYFHHEILKWWMSLKAVKCLTKSQNKYEQTIKNIIAERQISTLQSIFNINNIKYLGYTFSDNVLEVNAKTIVVTDIFTVTILKVIRYLQDNYAVLDLESIVNLSIEDFTALNVELCGTEKILIIVYNITKHSRNVYERLYDFAETTKKKKIIVITNNDFIESVQEFYPSVKVHYEPIQRLSDFTPESQRDIINKAQVLFQGEEVSLDLLLDSTSDACVDLIKGVVLDKIIHNETIIIGKSLSNPSYDKIKHLYVDRRVCLDSEVISSSSSSDSDDDEDDDKDDEYDGTIKTFNDIDDNIVVILAEAGMGKSTLLTHLSLKTKKIDKQVWIVRINLLDYTKEFKEWQDDKTVIDNLEVVKFMCQVVLDNNEYTIYLRETNNKVYLDTLKRNKDDNNNEWTTFVLSLFVHFYNEKKLSFLFDGFDEICPHYLKTVLTVIEVVKKHSQGHKIWVTSRSFNEILPDLQGIAGITYKIQYLNERERKKFLNNIWKDKIAPDKLDTDQIDNLKSLIDYKKRLEYVDLEICKRLLILFCNLLDYVADTFPCNLGNEIVSTDRIILYYLRLRFDKDYEDEDIIDSNKDRRDDSDSVVTLTPAMASLSRDLTCTPLFLYLLGNNIIDIVYSKKKPTQKLNLFSMYEMFIKTQLYEIRFEIKNNWVISKPDTKASFEEACFKCIDTHKKLAAHTLLKDSFFFYDEFEDMRPFFEDNCPKMEKILNVIKNAKEKTGLISHITEDNVPVFDHKTFGEYFASEFLCDIFKSESFHFNDKSLLYCVLTHKSRFMIDYWIHKKIKVDQNLYRIIKSIRSKSIGFSHIRDLSHLLNCALFICDYQDNDGIPHTEKIFHFKYKQLLRIYSSTVDDYEENFIVAIEEKLSKTYSEPIRTIKNDVFFSKIPEMNRSFDPNTLTDNIITYIRELIEVYVVGKMKPHFRKYFIDKM